MNGNIGNIAQFSDVWYTDIEIEFIPEKLNIVLDLMYKDKKNSYVGVVTNIKKIKGHI